MRTVRKHSDGVINYFDLLPNVIVDQTTLKRLESYFHQHPKILGEKSSHGGIMQQILTSLDDSTKDKRERRKRRADRADGHDEAGPIVRTSGAHPRAQSGDEWVNDQVLKTARSNRRIRECLSTIPSGAYAAIKAVFEPKRFDTECIDRLDGGVDLVPGPIDRRLGRFAFIALHTPMAHAWMVEETKRTGLYTDSPLPWLRWVCEKGNKATRGALMAEIEEIVQTAFNLFEAAWKARKARK